MRPNEFQIKERAWRWCRQRDNFDSARNIHCGVSARSWCFVFFWSSGCQFGCTVTVVTARRQVEHVKSAIQNIMPDLTPQCKLWLYNVRRPLKDLSSEEFVWGVEPVIEISLSDWTPQANSSVLEWTSNIVVLNNVHVQGDHGAQGLGFIDFT